MFTVAKSSVVTCYLLNLVVFYMNTSGRFMEIVLQNLETKKPVAFNFVIHFVKINDTMNLNLSRQQRRRDHLRE